MNTWWPIEHRIPDSVARLELTPWRAHDSMVLEPNLPQNLAVVSFLRILWGRQPRLVRCCLKKKKLGLIPGPNCGSPLLSLAKIRDSFVPQNNLRRQPRVVRACLGRGALSSVLT